MQNSVSIGEAARLTGTTLKKLRYWQEKKYLPEPILSTCGERTFRFYDEAHIAYIKRLQKYIDEGFTVKAASVKTSNDFNL